LRIVHVIPYFQPKLGYQEYYLAKEQQKLGHEVFVVCSDRYYPFSNYEETVQKVLGDRKRAPGTFYEESLMVVRLPTLLEFASDNIYIHLERTIKKINPDIIHAHGVFSYSTFCLCIMKRKYKYRLIVDCHMDYEHQSDIWYRRIIFKTIAKNRFYKNVLKQIDRFMGITMSSIKWLVQEHGLSESDIDFVPLGVDTDLFIHSTTSRLLIRKKYGIQDEDILIITAGRSEPNKNIDILLRSCIPLIKNQRTLKIMIIGSKKGTYYEQLYRIVIDSDVVENILFLEFVEREKLPAYYSAADIGIWPGKPSITIQEAMSTSLPIILADAESTRHLIHDNGLTYPNGNIISLREKTYTLLSDAVSMRLMGINSRILATNHFSWLKIAKNSLEIYEKVLEMQKC
jgi:glycosyltransferase involved in cell wall biosynthesis